MMVASRAMPPIAFSRAEPNAQAVSKSDPM